MRLFVALALVASISSGNAAEPESADLRYFRELVETRNYSLGQPVSPKITPDGKAVIFLRGGARDPVLRLYEFTIADAKLREILTPGEAAPGRGREAHGGGTEPAGARTAEFARLHQFSVIERRRSIARRALEQVVRHHAGGLARDRASRPRAGSIRIFRPMGARSPPSMAASSTSSISKRKWISP